MTDKGIVFCHTCNNIVGDSFPVHHYHSFELRNEMLNRPEIQQYIGFKFYTDTPEIRERLMKDFPPRTEIVLKL